MIDLNLDILQWLGTSEQEIISRARLLIKIGKPPSDLEREIHRGKLLAQQAEIVNLESNVYYHLSIKERDFNARKFDLWDAEEYREYTKSERDTVAIIRDAELSDLNETIIKLKILQKYLEKMSWIMSAASK